MRAIVIQFTSISTPPLQVDPFALYALVLAVRRAIDLTGQTKQPGAPAPFLFQTIPPTTSGQPFEIRVEIHDRGLWPGADRLIDALMKKPDYAKLPADCRDCLFQLFTSLQGKWAVSIEDSTSSPVRSASISENSLIAPPNPGLVRRLLTPLESCLRWLLRYPLMTAQVVLLFFMSWGLVGRGLGIEGLFWHESWYYQGAVGLSAGWLLGVIFFIRYLLDSANASEVTARSAWLDNHVPSLLPSSDPGVNRLGRYLLLALLICFALLILPKFAFRAFWRDGGGGMVQYLTARMWFGPMIVGLALSLLFAWFVYKIDEWYGIRNWIQKWKWFRTQWGMTSGRIPAADWPLHAVAVYLGGVTLVLLLVGIVLSYTGFVTPFALFSLFLVLANVVSGYMAFQVRLLRLAGLVVILMLIAFNSTWLFPSLSYKFRFPTMEKTTNVLIGVTEDGSDLYDAMLQDAAGRPENPKLLKSETLLVEMRNRWQSTHGKNSKPRLVVVSTSGGGIRAAVWTAVVLDGLETEFAKNHKNAVQAWRDQIRLFTGASGGMQGAALYVADFERPPSERSSLFSPETGLGALSGVLAKDSLTPTVQTMLLRDFALSPFLPGPIDWDRGRALEQAWDEGSARWLKTDMPAYDDGDKGGKRHPFRRRIAALRPLEEKAERPSLIFSPMMVEDSRRLLISNLNLSDLTTTSGNQRATSGTPEGTKTLALSAVEYSRLFPNATALEVGTAVRMNATFPVVGPAVSLPTTPPRRLVDAGYYDNYGVNLAMLWLYRHREAVRTNTSGVVLVQIRAYRLSYAGQHFRDDDPLTGDDKDEEGDKPKQVPDKPKAKPAGSAPRIPVASDPVMEALGVVSAPADAILTARGRAAYYRNNEQIDLLQETFNTGPVKHFFTTVAFELENQSPLSWYLPQVEARQIVLGFYQDVERTRMRKWIKSRFNSLEKWLGTDWKKAKAPPVPKKQP